MSCGNPTVETDALMPKKKRYDKTKQCVRCKVVEGNIVIRHAVYCKECFFPLMTHKFRRSLEPHVNLKPDGPRRTALKPSGNLMVGISGGLGSTVLLDLVHRCYIAMDQSTMPEDGGAQHPRHERVWKKVAACYVEICDAFPEIEDRTADVEQLVERYSEIEFIPLRLQDAFDRRWWERIQYKAESINAAIDLTDEELLLVPHLASISSTEDPVQALRIYLASLPTATAVSSTVKTITRLLLQFTAWETGSSHLVLGTSLTSLAMSLISSVSQGAGFNIKEEMQEEWAPDSGARGEAGRKRTVRVIRPLRDMGRKECAMWAWWMGLSIVGKAPWPWLSSRQDIGALTRDFIGGLEKDYPSTVSTIVRTCTKVAPKGESSGICVLCARPIQAGVQEWKSRISIRSRSPPSNPHETEKGLSLTPFLCYACHTTLTSKSSRPTPSLDTSMTKPSAVPLPTWVGPQLSQRDEVFRAARMGKERMQGVVQDFLLDDG
ncbi:uncharacterized protein LAESUDRAFT_701114 [Laetiporus sulphureus 93-53]|uniref:Cytoplasmic tRNA 2-thiolation protein 2 n=1 Tax=Laetiporus sulphureus 93-53 TaxID=1314785 RepID=A0A165E3D2_9APHY|nr:uncharacterized protein LAESUDRAFT_701114 [Laetiporus sulphureus 93-53]KZT06167.1 hypothetical protein LAESUDRAFT_701114 [Laetiporus sulphureus 93-53]